MKKTVFPALCAVLLFTACKKDEYSKYPSCVRDAIRALQHDSSCASGSYIKQYTFQQQTVYEVHACGADYSTVLGNDCDQLGITGGFAGNMVINGENFNNAVYVTTVWEN